MFEREMKYRRLKLDYILFPSPFGEGAEGGLGGEKEGGEAKNVGFDIVKKAP